VGVGSRTGGVERSEPGEQGTTPGGASPPAAPP